MIEKTLWEKEKLLVTSNFSFYYNVFHSYIFLVRQNSGLCGNGLSNFQDHWNVTEITDLINTAVWIMLTQE